MNKKTTLGLIALVAVVLGTSLVIGLGGRGAGALCEGASSKSYTVTIRDDKASIFSVYGKLCDKITFVNDDKITREIAFGAHEDHVAYDGVPEKILNQNQSFTITLNQAGHFHWHDHNHDEVEGYFNVAQ